MALVHLAFVLLVDASGAQCLPVGEDEYRNSQYFRGLSAVVGAVKVSLNTDPNVFVHWPRRNQIGTLSNRLGIQHFSWGSGTGLVKIVQLTDRVTGNVREGRINFLSENELRGADGPLVIWSAQETVEYMRTAIRHGDVAETAKWHRDWEWKYFEAVVPHIRFGTDTNIMFIMTTVIDKPFVGKVPILVGYAQGKAHRGSIELNFVETAPAFEGQSVAKVLATYVLSDSQLRGFNKAYVSNSAGLNGARAYLAAAANAGFTDVQGTFPDPISDDESDGGTFIDNTITLQKVKIVNLFDEVTAITAMCEQARPLLMAAYGWMCVCEAAAPNHCFNYRGIIDLKFSK